MHSQILVITRMCSLCTVGVKDRLVVVSFSLQIIIISWVVFFRGRDGLWLVFAQLVMQLSAVRDGRAVARHTASRSQSRIGRHAIAIARSGPSAGPFVCPRIACDRPAPVRLLLCAERRCVGGCVLVGRRQRWGVLARPGLSGRCSV